MRALIVLLMAVTGPMYAQSSDEVGVRQAALDYLEGFYEGDSTKHLRSVRPEVYKYGYYREKVGDAYRGSQMTWAGFMQFTRRVREQGNQAPATAPKAVQLLDVQDQTAAVKVTAWWGTDYLLMGKFDGRWMITHVTWQSVTP